MVNTSAYPVTVDGVRLDTFAWNISTKQGRDASPGMSGSNFESGQTDGEIWVPNKRAAPGRAVLSMWVGGTDADGVVPADSYLKYRQNLDQLYRMFSVTHRLLDVRQQIDVAGAQIRQALCEVGAIIDPEMLTNFPYTGKFAVELRIPGAFWQSVADVNYDSNVGLVANTTIDLPVFAPSTAPMRKQYIVLDGPATNPRMIDNRNGHWLQLNAAVPVGQQWVVNTELWTSRVGAGIAFTQGGTDKFSVTEFAGGHSPSLFGITADPLGPQIRIEGSGFGAGTRLRLRGKLQYL
jgi:hypothetical protein